MLKRRGRGLTALAILLVAVGLAAPAAGGRERPNARIVGGVSTTIEEWPWQVALYDDFFGQICGGSLIAPDLVVTAAHCVHNGLTFDPPSPRYSVRSGTDDLSGSEGTFTDVTSIFYFAGNPSDPDLATTPAPPLYQPFDDSWDAVVLVLAAPAPAPAAPIRIAGPGESATWAPGADAAITGWGSTKEGGNGTDILREAAIEVLPDQNCENAYEPEGFEYETVTMMCAGLETGGRDTCQGDSGGPLVVPLGAGGFRLVGDTSFGIGCARAEFPGVYGRLAANPMRGAIGEFAAARGYDVIGSGGQPGTFTQTAGPTPPPPPPEDPPVDPAPTTPRCVVPGLRGKTIPKARRTLRARHCRLGTVTRRRSARFRRGRVIRQRPSRGTRRAAGFRVRVVVSSGRR